MYGNKEAMSMLVTSIHITQIMNEKNYSQLRSIYYGTVNGNCNSMTERK